MDKQYVIPESEEIRIHIENNIMSTEIETPDIPQGPGGEE